MRFLTLLCSAWLSLLAIPNLSNAALPAQLKLDFAPTSGAVVLLVANEYLINIDAAANLLIGDILTLIVPGEKVLHPITKNVLGSIDNPIGFLQVIRIESGYAYAKLLYSDAAPEKGQQTLRYSRVPARFIAKQGAAEKVYAELKEQLPQLKWLSPRNPAEALLFFTLEGNLLTVSTQGQSSLHSYDLLQVQPESSSSPKPN